MNSRGPVRPSWRLLLRAAMAATGLLVALAQFVVGNGAAATIAIPLLLGSALILAALLWITYRHEA